MEFKRDKVSLQQPPAKREYFRPRYFHTSIWPLYYLSRVLGIAPFRFVENAHVVGIRKTLPGTLYALVLAVMVETWVLYRSANKILGKDANSSTIFVIIQTTTGCLSSSACVSALLLAITFNFRRWQIIAVKMFEVDRMLLQNPEKVYRRTVIFLIVEIFLVMGVLGSFHSYEIITKKNRQYRYAVRVFIHITNVTMIMQYSNLVLLIRQRLGVINEKLQQLIDECEQAPVRSKGFWKTGDRYEQTPVKSKAFWKTGNTVGPEEFGPDFENRYLRLPRYVPGMDNIKNRDICKEIHVLRQVYHVLCDVLSDLTNSCYGIPLLLAITYVFASSVKYVHVILLMMRNPEAESLNSFNVNGMGAVVSFVVIHIMKVVLISAACTATKSTAEETAVLVNALLLLYPPQSSVSAELQLFTVQFCKGPMEFTASRFFMLDYSFLTAFIGALTTYTVILLQFSDP